MGTAIDNDRRRLSRYGAASTAVALCCRAVLRALARPLGPTTWRSSAGIVWDSGRLGPCSLCGGVLGAFFGTSSDPVCDETDRARRASTPHLHSKTTGDVLQEARA